MLRVPLAWKSALSADPNSAPPGAQNTLTVSHSGVEEAAPRGSPARTLEAGVLLAGRYRLQRELGRGATGTVYEALDEARAEARVALKLLHESRPESLYRLKNEFRALSATAQENLVGLHALGSDARGWFVVMDLVAEATDFTHYVRPRLAAGYDEPRLRAALVQLLQGVGAIHRTGKLHRDLKPSNVLVTPAGRVVIVDFGLVDDLHGDASPRRRESPRFVGTPAYAAPEQALGAELGSAADLYAVGAMLFEALTGRLPFDDSSTLALLRSKVEREAPRVSDRSGFSCDDLVQLCADLLQRDPRARPTLEQALARLGVSRLDSGASPHALFVGREQELTALQTCLESARRGGPQVAVVRGASGIGKSALVAEACEQARSQRGAVVLSGRCHTHEQVPFNAFDALMEALARHLSSLDALDAGALMPRDAALLKLLFPTLDRVEALARLPHRMRPGEDDALRKTRAVAALKELLGRIADGAPLLLTLDDLQWRDSDSEQLLAELLRGPEAPSCLFVCVLRVEDEAALPAALAQIPEARRLELRLGPLGASLSASLARSLLVAATLDEQAVARLVSEADGSPFFIRALAQAASTTGTVRGVSEVVRARVDMLPEPARRLLQVVALAGHPVEFNAACRAAEVDAHALAHGAAAALLRTVSQAGRDYVECVHDRIREEVVCALPSASCRRLRVSLARAYAEHPDADPELVTLHYERAGLPRDAARYARGAAERAARVLAFGRAATLYRLALGHAQPDERHALSLALARVLASAGRVAEAAAQYELAMASAPDPDAARVLGGRSMMLHLLAGNVAAGSLLAEQLCRSHGVLVPARSERVAGVINRLMVLRYLSGPRVAELSARHTHAAPPVQRQLELSLSAMRGFANWSPRHSLHFMLCALLTARRARDPAWLPMAAAWELTGIAYVRGASDDVEEQAMERAVARSARQATVPTSAVGGARDAEAEVVGQGSAELSERHALVLAAQGARCFYLGRMEEAERCFERSEQVIERAGLCVPTVCNANRSGRYAVWFASGAYAGMLTHSERWLAESLAHGDPWGALVVQVMGSQRFLVLDQPDLASASLTALDTPLGRRSTFDADPWWAAEIALYQGDALAAREAYRRACASPHRAAKRQNASHRCWEEFCRGRVALACARWAFQPAALRVVRQAARELERERYVPARAMHAQLLGSLAACRGERGLALRLLAHAESSFVAQGMHAWAYGARFQRGTVSGDAAGGALAEDALAAARTLGIRNPARFLRAMCVGPGQQD